MAAFPGGCTLACAEKVCHARPEQVASLVDHSLLRRSDTEAGPRYWMLETVQAVAKDLLLVNGREPELIEGLGRWLLEEIPLRPDLGRRDANLGWAAGEVRQPFGRDRICGGGRASTRFPPDAGDVGVLADVGAGDRG